MVKKVAQYMADVLEDSKDKVQENLLASGGELISYDSWLLVCDIVLRNIRKDGKSQMGGGLLWQGSEGGYDW